MTEYLLTENNLAYFSRQIKSQQNRLLFLDYDGTLAPFKEDPQKAVPLPGIAELLQKIRKKKGLTVCLISGRSLKDLQKLIDLKGMYSAGLHGLEVTAPDQSPLFQTQLKDKANTAPEITVLKNELRANLNLPGVKIEEKGPVLTVHHPPGPGQQKIKNFLAELADRDKMEIMEGRQIVEVRPRGWNKGRTVDLLIKELINAESGNYLTIYLGDDSTDEDAFKSLKDNQQALTVYIKNESSLSTAADYYLRNPADVMVLLKKIDNIL